MGTVLLLGTAAITAVWGLSSPLSLRCHRAGVSLCCLLGGCNLGSSVPGSAPGTLLLFPSVVMPGGMQRAGKYQQCMDRLCMWALWVDFIVGFDDVVVDVMGGLRDLESLFHRDSAILLVLLK